MSTYAIGDIQGCFHSFQDMLQRIAFNPKQDRLWLVGDLVNRGTGSLDVLRWLYQHRASIVTVLGNHDLHALVVAEGIAKAHRSDTLQELMAAEDSLSLLTWLRNQPLIHAEQGYVMVHAGLLPGWSVEQGLQLGEEVSLVLRSDHYRQFLLAMYGNTPSRWHDSLQGMDRLRAITNAMTRLRVCTESGEMDFKFKGELVDIPAGYLPWFDIPTRLSKDSPIIFGHWSALGLLERPNLFALDTGCLWGRQLSALRLEDRQIVQVPCNPRDVPPGLQLND